MYGIGKIGYLTSEKKEPGMQDLFYSSWDTENSTDATWLINSMEEGKTSSYMCYHTTKELWDYVNLIYSETEIQSQIHEIMLKLGEIHHSEDDIIKYFNSLK